MKPTSTALTQRCLQAGAGLLLAALCASALAAPAQLPLLSRDGWEGKPNVVFTLDDSGSMDWSWMPDEMFSRYPAGNGYNTGFDPAERGMTPYSRSRFISTDPTDMSSVAWRSSHHNFIYYNPNIRYRPWAKSDGTRFPDSPPAAARVNPVRASDGTADLTVKGNVRDTWCVGSDCRNRTMPYTAAMYFQYDGGDDTNPSNFTPVTIRDHASFVRPDTRTECNVDISNPSSRVCTQAQEMQNFANWFTYYRRRMYLAIGSTAEAFAQQGNGLRLGYGRINKGTTSIDGKNSGALVRGVRTYDGQDRTDFFDWLHVQAPTGNTPLRLAMSEVGKYFERKDNRGPWGARPGLDDDTPQLECRKSYHILMSDGYWNSSPASDGNARQNVDGNVGPQINGPGGQQYKYQPIRPYTDNRTDTLADIAMYYWNRDLHPDLGNRVRPDSENPAFWQQLVQFTVGLGVGGMLDPENDLERLIDGTLSWPNPLSGEAAKIDDMWHAAVNSHGRYLSAKDPQGFATALSSILQSISERETAEGGAAVSSITLETESYKYIPTYSTSRWSGDVQAKALDSNGVAVADLWKASQVLPAPDARNIVVGKGESAPANVFKWDSLTTEQKTLLGPNGSKDLINYLRGDRSKEGGTFRQREATTVLGDMVNSTPLLVGALVNEQYQFLPANVAGGASYRDFIYAKKSRDPVLFIGANDGMLHAFRSEDGVEAFAFVPFSVLPNLNLLAQPAYEHRFFVDGPLIEADAYVSGQWRNYVLGSLGGGGRAVFAIDATDTDNLGTSSVKWEFTHPELGYVMAPMAVGIGKNGKWQAYIGNGFESNSGKAQLLVVDLATGNLVKKIDTGAGGGNGLGGVALIKDVNQVVTGAYAGDLKGNLWRFDMSSSSTADWQTGFGGNPLYVAKDSNNIVQPITAQPIYVDHPRGGQLVVFGSGKLYTDNDLTNYRPQTLYGVWDTVTGDEQTADGQQMASSDILVEQSFGPKEVSGDTEYFTVSNNLVDYDQHRGWKLPMSLEAGQRLIYTPQYVRGFVLFSTVAPTGGTGMPCDDSRSTGYNVLVNALTGARSTKPIMDTNNDGKIDENDSLASAYQTVADGKDTIMLGKQGKVSVQRAFGETNVLLNGRGLERTWRQLLNYPRAVTF